MGSALHCTPLEGAGEGGGGAPLMLGAHLGSFEMFAHKPACLLIRCCCLLLSLLPVCLPVCWPQVTSYSLPLREIDTVQGEDGPDGGYVPNALEVVVRKTHLGMLEVRGYF